MTKIIGQITLDDEYVDAEVCYEMEIDQEKLEDMKELAKKVTELGVYEVSIFDSNLDAYEGNIETISTDPKESIREFSIIKNNAEDHRLDCVLLHVAEGKFRYTGYLKHTTVHFSTRFIYFTDIEGKEVYIA